LKDIRRKGDKMYLLLTMHFSKHGGEKFKTLAAVGKLERRLEIKARLPQKSMWKPTRLVPIMAEAVAFA
jgi:hypothetical protein